MTILVTGASGLIGSHLCKRLVDNGEDVVGLTYKTSNPLLVSIIRSNLVTERCDIRDYSAVKSIIRKYSPQTVFHFAARLPHTANPDFIEVNVIGTTNLLDACYTNRVENFIYASSMSSYSTPPSYLPINEEHPTRPDNDYGRTKLIGELLCECFSEVLRAVVIRYSSVFGVGDTVRAAYHFMKASLTGQTILVDGDGSQSSDFIYVNDAIDGALQVLDKGRSGQVYNIGSGQETSVLGLACHINHLSSPVPGVALSKKPATRTFRFVADIGKARSELGYNPSSLLEGLRKYREGMQKNSDGLLIRTRRE